MAARGDGWRHDRAGPPAGPPPRVGPRTWDSVEQARAEIRQTRSGPRDAKARARASRARAAERASAAAAQRRAAISRQHALRAAQRRQAANRASREPVPPVRETPVARRPPVLRRVPVVRPDRVVRRRPARPDGGASLRSTRSRRSPGWVPAGIAAGVIVVLALTGGVLTAAEQLDGLPGSGADAPAQPGAAPTGVAAPARQTGDYVQSRVDAEGRLVTQHLIVRDEPIPALSVRLASDSASSAVTPVLQSLDVVAAGRPVAFDARQVADTGTSTVSLRAGTRTVLLRYVTESVQRQDGPSSPRRALVLVNPLEVEATPDAAVEGGFVQLAGNVLNLACVPSDGLPTSCGHPDPVGWRVRLEQPGAVEVLAQVDLPTT